MSIHDPEVLEALRDQPELLAIADAVEETQRPVRSPRRRVVTRSAALVAVGVAVLVAVLLWPSGGKRNPILDRALAAIGDGPVLHLVTQAPSVTEPEIVDLRTGRSTVPKVVFETWSDRSMKHYHLLMRDNGRVIDEILFPQDRTPGMQVGPVDASYTALWSGYREALAGGKATITGGGTLYEHRVYFLQFASRFGNSPRHEVAVDRATYEPVAFRSVLPGRNVDTRVLLFRMEPYSSTDFQRRTSMPNPISGGSHGTAQVEPVRPGKPAKPWLTVGSSIAGLKLTAVNQLRTTSIRGVSKGFELVYGSQDRARRSLTVDEEKRPPDASEWKGIPHGSMRLEVGGGSGGNATPHTLWTGYLVRDGVYVTIETGLGRAALLEAARALQPA